MIILDFNQVALANLLVQGTKNVEIDENLLRHMILNSIRMNNTKFSKEYGQLVIACDATDNWRKQYYPYYKANRKKNRDESSLNWNEVFRILNTIREELFEYFPYPTIRVDTAEADDIIAALCHEYGRYLGGDPILILSGDKDFQQLQKYSNVDQYDPTRKRWIKCNDPQKFLLEHILKGDTSDGIPNILSADDTFVVGARQKQLRSTFINATLSADYPEDCTLFTEEIVRNYYRNKQLIDLDQVPDYIRESTIQIYNDQMDKDRSKLFNYFIKYKLKHLHELIAEF